jgi:hypothetical protein
MHQVDGAVYFTTFAGRTSMASGKCTHRTSPLAIDAISLRDMDARAPVVREKNAERKRRTKTTRRNICGNQNGRTTSLEFTKNPVTFAPRL